MPGQRIIIVGLDGVPYQLVRDLAESDALPNVAALIREGLFRQMASSLPEVSSVAWSSIITGANPGEHGIFGFTDVVPGTYRVFFPSYNDLKTAAFWDQDSDRRSVIINVPATYPARAMNGVHVAGFVAPDLTKAVWPSSLLPLLKELDYRVDVETDLAAKSISLFLEELNKTLEARIALSRHLWAAEEWQTFMLVFTGPDRLSHFLWDACQDSSRPYHAAYLDYLRRVDTVIGELVQRMDEEDTILLLSDHGFEQLEKDVHVNYLLQQEGFLAFDQASPAQLRQITEKSRAFALDPGRIYVHLKGRFPRGGVEVGDRERVLADLADIFRVLTIEGKPVIRRVYRKEEIYHGPCLAQAPDLVLLANAGFNLQGSFKAQQLWGQGRHSGKHSQDNAFLLVKGRYNEKALRNDLSVSDVLAVLDSRQ